MRGGRRVGAGRKAGAQNLVTQKLREQIMKEGITPLEFLLAIMRDSEQPFNVRLEAARIVAPFLHPRLQSIEHTATDGEARPQCIEVVFVKPDSHPKHDRPAPEGESAAPCAIHQEPKALTFLR
jgi:hypothetical protein